MSYQTIKQALGETSLERKCRFLFGICLLVLITASFSWYGAVTDRLVRKQTRTTGRFLVRQVLLQEHWENLESREEFKQLIQYLGESLSKEQYERKEQFERAFIYPRGMPRRAPPHDEFEFALLDRFSKGRPADLPTHETEYAEREVDGGRFVEYYQAVRLDDFCLRCHIDPVRSDLASGNFGGSSVPGAAPLGKGDLMCIAKVTIPTEQIQVESAKNRAILVATAIITAFLAMLASYVIVRYVIVKPLRHLRDVSDAISHGNINLRAEIHTGDEFEGLALAFNRMLRHLVSAQEELRQVNASLDGKVDELAQVNMRLYEMNRVKSEFLATMSHELRTPLNSILGFSEVLKGIDALDEKQKRYVQNIQKSGRTLLDMINDILDLAKMEAGRMELRPTDFRIEQVVAAQSDMTRPLAEKKNIDVEYLIEPDLPPVHQDQARVQQILNNLLSNAIKFTPEGGRVKIVARREEPQRLVLQVIDTGVGIAEEDQQVIFEKFRQGQAAQPGGDAMTREYSGTGLGLSIVKELCRLLQGEVTVESTLGKGSTFTVQLPWRLSEPLPPDLPLADGLDDFARRNLDLAREPHLS